MRFALSTNWNNQRLDDGAAIADEALALGFDALELGFHTMPEQLPGIRSRLDRLPVDSVHAYCPVPIGAPSGHPELHQLAHPDETERALARLLMRKTIACAAELGAKVVVTHAGYVDLDGLFVNCGADVLRQLLRDKDGKADVSRPIYRKYLAKALRRRAKRGRKLLEAFKRSLDELLPDLEAAHVTLALENLPRLEGFPNADEGEQLMKDYAGAPVRLWLDTGHARVRECHQWSAPLTEIAERVAPYVCGMHLNDVRDFHDDHRQPGWGGVDFGALKSLANRDVLRVFEPHVPVSFDELKDSLERIRALWTVSPS
ncbi:MAG: sugar phosphate isomerase/epimerase family protein [Kiritimatiellia bacterium]